MKINATDGKNQKLEKKIMKTKLRFYIFKPGGFCNNQWDMDGKYLIRTKCA